MFLGGECVAVQLSKDIFNKITKGKPKGKSLKFISLTRGLSSKISRVSLYKI
jgi:hypothetical protein